MFDTKTLTISVAGREIHLETGKVARQADGSVIIRMGDTILLVTACASPEAGPNADFLGLRVDYQEKMSSCGRTLGGFIKREGRPTERETLVCRLIDRPLRPMFPDGYFHEVQVLAYVLSYDGIHIPDTLAICGASAALSLSSIPLIKPIGAVRVGMVDGVFVVNPTLEELKKSKLDLVLAGTHDAILMIEGYCDFLTEEQLLEAIDEGHAAIKQFCDGISDWQKLLGKPKQATFRNPSAELETDLVNRFGSELRQILNITQKQQRSEQIGLLKARVLAHYAADDSTTLRHDPMVVQAAFKNANSHMMRRMILEEGRRNDGRRLDEVRPIHIDLGPLPCTHGSALFTRGETQALAVCTLGGETMAMRYEDLNEESARTFYLQYSFPPFSVGEVGRMGTPGRREIGHGKLAERALSAVVPSKEQFPYTIRLESNITESNGSSSMASVCGGCLAMMQAGVPVRPIAGIAMGLILEEDKFSVLSDILGDEDALGDMDFKITGDMQGITAFQLDIKVEGINRKIMQTALAQAKEGRIHILQKMIEVCPKHQAELSSRVPRIEVVKIKPSKIGAVIGPGGKQIRAIEELGVKIEIDDSGLINICSTSSEAIAKARALIENITGEVEVGQIYDGVVVSITDFGAFVKIFEKEGLCHISELAHRRVQKVEEVCKVGDILKVKVLEVSREGKVRLSHKALLPPPAPTGKPAETAAPVA